MHSDFQAVVLAAFLALLGFLCVAFGTPATGFAATDMAPDIQSIVTRGTLRVAAYQHDLPPFIFTKDDGSLDGIDVKLAEDIASKLGVKVEFIRTTANFNELPAMLAERKADLIISALSVTLQRAKAIRFTRPYVRLRKAVMINRIKTVGDVETAADVGKLDRPEIVIGANQGSAYAQFAHELFPNATLRTYARHREAAPDLQAGTIQAFLCDETCSDSYNRKQPWQKDRPFPEWGLYVQTFFIPGGTDPIAIGVHPEDAMLQEWLNQYLAAAADNGSLAALTGRFLDQGRKPGKGNSGHE
ncbi:substrate-binding periplasmic protein [Azospirillum sp. sgz302134]